MAVKADAMLPPAAPVEEYGFSIDAYPLENTTMWWWRTGKFAGQLQSELSGLQLNGLKVDETKADIEDCFIVLMKEAWVKKQL